MSNDIDYLETAKANIAKITGDNQVEVVKAISLVVIANALIAIAEKAVVE